jgi:hypothetical protein
MHKTTLPIPRDSLKVMIHKEGAASGLLYFAHPPRWQYFHSNSGSSFVALEGIHTNDLSVMSHVISRIPSRAL